MRRTGLRKRVRMHRPVVTTGHKAPVGAAYGHPSAEIMAVKPFTVTALLLSAGINPLV